MVVEILLASREENDTDISSDIKLTGLEHANDVILSSENLRKLNVFS